MIERTGDLLAFILEHETEPRRIDVIRLHTRANARFTSMCGMCGDEGQNFDCTYPCDFLRVYAERFEDEPGYRMEWRP